MFSLFGRVKTYALWGGIAVISLLWALLSMAKKDNKNLKLKQKYRDTEAKLQQRIIAANKDTAVRAAEELGDDRIERNKKDAASGIVHGFGKLRRKRSNSDSSGDP